MHISFEGAASEVTGSRYRVVATVQGRPLQFLVDCGMFQGGRDADDKNLESFKVPPSELDWVVLTHAHIDHSGMLPRLCAKGFRGPIFCTPATLSLLQVLLMDSAHIQGQELERAVDRQAKGKWRGPLPEPLYSSLDVEQCLSQCRPIPLHQRHSIRDGVDLEFFDAGHILGAAIARIHLADDEAPAESGPKRLVFTGDIGTRDRPLMNNPERLPDADVLVIESTYGDRLHRSLQSTEDELVDIIQRTIAQGGNVVIPAFAVGRTQEIIAILIDLIQKQRLPFLSIFVDSPMATQASKITEQNLRLLNERTQSLYHWLAAHPNAARVRFTADVNESKALNQIKAGAVILSASGMCEAGRIIHHLFWNLPRPQSAVVIAGFQAAGTRGRLLVDGQKTLRLLGQEVPVKASIHTVGGLSAHGDQSDLLWWCQGFEHEPSKVFITHGERAASENFAVVLQSELGWRAPIIPQRGQLFPC